MYEGHLINDKYFPCGLLIVLLYFKVILVTGAHQDVKKYNAQDIQNKKPDKFNFKFVICPVLNHLPHA